jgi:hypothetical protein
MWIKRHWYRGVESSDRCLHPQAQVMDSVTLVTGKGYYASSMRNSYNPCNIEGVLFEPYKKEE